MIARFELAAVGGATVAAGAAPATAAHHAAITRRRTRWVFRRTLLLVVLAVPIEAPFPDIAVQVVQPQSVGRIRADRRGPFEECAARRPTIRIIAIEISECGRQR